GEELVGDVLEQRFVLEELGREAVHVDRVAVNVALGIEVAVELEAGGDAVDDLDAAELDQPVAFVGVEPRRLGVDDDLAQHPASPEPYASTYLLAPTGPPPPCGEGDPVCRVEPASALRPEFSEGCALPALY